MRLFTYGALALIALLLAWGMSEGATFSFENRGDKTIVMTLYWLDHNIDSHFGPVAMMCSELKSGGRFDGSSSYMGHYFNVHVYNTDTNYVKPVLIKNMEDHTDVIWSGEGVKLE
jgi:hypothetical protein